MTQFFALTKRNLKLFFKDKGMFFTSLITPLILLLLYGTFLANLYLDSFRAAIPQGFFVPDELIDGMVGGQLFSSLLAVCCVTVAFCANMLMVQDKVSGAGKDLSMTPAKPFVMAMSYYTATYLSTLLVCYVASAAGLLYIAANGWYLSFVDVLCLFGDVALLTMFGTALSGIVNHFLSTQAQISAVGTIVSAGYGFICGAYIPIASFGDTLKKVVGFLPGTYGTSLIRNHALRGAYAEMETLGFPSAVIEGIKDSIDCNFYFFDTKVPIGVMALILGASTFLLVSAYVFISYLKARKAK